MKYKGKVSHMQVNDTGESLLDYDYFVGIEEVPSIDSLLDRYVGQNIELTIEIKEVENENIEDEAEDWD